MKKIKNFINKIGSSKLLSIAILLIVELSIYTVIYNFLYNRITIIFGGFTLISIILMIQIINSETNTSYKLSWIALILAFQGGGALLYLYVNFDSLYKTIKAYHKKVKTVTCSYLKEDKKTKEKLLKDNKLVYGMSNYAYESCGYPIYQNTNAKYFKIGEEYFESLKEDLKAAKKYILLEYFIINNDYMWQTVLNILINKVKEGVEVRVMYDGFGTLFGLPSHYESYLERNGIKTAIFSEVKMFLAIHQNNRDHRKIVVIDGKIGYTGGINLADEYINRKVRFGHWKDTGIRIEGEAVRSMTMMFFELWQTVRRENISYENYLISYKVPSDGFILPYADSPFDNITIAEDIYLNILNSSTDYVYITTPYLVLDDHLSKALDNAVKRGVRVVIIVPHIPDKKYIYYLAISHYKSLVNRGVEIYEYTPGFIHAKSFVSDDKIGVVGTANLDYRSLYLHFECGIELYKSKMLKDLKKDIEETIKVSQRVDRKYIANISIFKKICGRILRIIAPLM